MGPSLLCSLQYFKCWSSLAFCSCRKFAFQHPIIPLTFLFGISCLFICFLGHDNKWNGLCLEISCVLLSWLFLVTSFSPLVGYPAASNKLTYFGSSLAAVVLQRIFLNGLGMAFSWKWKIIGWRHSLRSCFLFFIGVLQRDPSFSVLHWFREIPTGSLPLTL